MQLLMFYGFGFFALFGAIGMVMSRQPVMSALLLIVNMFCLAGLYAQLDAHVIAALQLIVYAGAVMVLVLFVIMLLNLREKQGIVSKHQVALQAVGISALGFFVTAIIARLEPGKLPAAKEPAEGFGTMAAVGKLLFTDYLLPFEIASVLLLAAMVGAVILAKSKV
ncbi:MAG: NADH-quinone oxidoreductase subunit J [Nitrospinae bacterium]|nr:NADH-quinone oxidoreductase subunit J [Nitrospinota bacterium]